MKTFDGRYKVRFGSFKIFVVALGCNKNLLTTVKGLIQELINRCLEVGGPSVCKIRMDWAAAEQKVKLQQVNKARQRIMELPDNMIPIEKYVGDWKADGRTVVEDQGQKYVLVPAAGYKQLHRERIQDVNTIRDRGDNALDVSEDEIFNKAQAMTIAMMIPAGTGAPLALPSASSGSCSTPARTGTAPAQHTPDPLPLPAPPCSLMDSFGSCLRAVPREAAALAQEETEDEGPAVPATKGGGRGGRGRGNNGGIPRKAAAKGAAGRRPAGTGSSAGADALHAAGTSPAPTPKNHQGGAPKRNLTAVLLKWLQDFNATRGTEKAFYSIKEFRVHTRWLNRQRDDFKEWMNGNIKLSKDYDESMALCKSFEQSIDVLKAVNAVLAAKTGPTDNLPAALIDMEEFHTAFDAAMDFLNMPPKSAAHFPAFMRKARHTKRIHVEKSDADFFNSLDASTLEDNGFTSGNRDEHLTNFIAERISTWCQNRTDFPLDRFLEFVWGAPPDKLPASTLDSLDRCLCAATHGAERLVKMEPVVQAVLPSDFDAPTDAITKAFVAFPCGRTVVRAFKKHVQKNQKINEFTNVILQDVAHAVTLTSEADTSQVVSVWTSVADKLKDVRNDDRKDVAERISTSVEDGARSALRRCSVGARSVLGGCSVGARSVLGRCSVGVRLLVAPPVAI